MNFHFLSDRILRLPVSGKCQLPIIKRKNAVRKSPAIQVHSFLSFFKENTFHFRRRVISRNLAFVLFFGYHFDQILFSLSY